MSAHCTGTNFGVCRTGTGSTSIVRTGTGSTGAVRVGTVPTGTVPTGTVPTGTGRTVRTGSARYCSSWCLHEARTIHKKAST